MLLLIFLGFVRYFSLFSAYTSIRMLPVKFSFKNYILVNEIRYILCLVDIKQFIINFLSEFWTEISCLRREIIFLVIKIKKRKSIFNDKDHFKYLESLGWFFVLNWNLSNSRIYLFLICLYEYENLSKNLCLESTWIEEKWRLSKINLIPSKKVKIF